MVSRRLIAAVLMAALVSAGCTSLKSVPPAVPGDPPFGPVQPGDTVVVQTRGGERARFVVHRIDGDALIAPDNRRYLRAELVNVQHKTFSGAKTTALVAGIAGGIYAAIALAVGIWLGENSR